MQSQEPTRAPHCTTTNTPYNPLIAPKRNLSSKDKYCYDSVAITHVAHDEYDESIPLFVLYSKSLKGLESARNDEMVPVQQ